MILFVLIGCAIAPPNVEVCVKLIRGAQCAYTIEGESRRISDDEYNEIGRFSISYRDYAEIRKFIEEACQKLDCKDIKKKIREFEKSAGVQ